MAASPGARGGTPSGLGLDSEAARRRMVDAVRATGVVDAEVLAALAAVHRHRFVDAGLASRAYEDVALPIGQEQTISRPSTVGRMLALALQPLDSAARRRATVLEVGTGCGYQAAVLACVVGNVVSIERVRWLHELARANLRAHRIPNLRLAFGDGHLGVPELAPYAAIVVAAAGPAIPDALLEQMAPGARLVAPIASAAGQSLYVVERTAREEWRYEVLDAVRFVPMKSGTI